MIALATGMCPGCDMKNVLTFIIVLFLLCVALFYFTPFLECVIVFAYQLKLNEEF